MRKNLFLTVSAIALMAAGSAVAQDKGAGPLQTSPAAQSAQPSPGGGEMRGGGEPRGGAERRGGAEPKGEPKGGRAEQRMDRGDQPQRAQDRSGPAREDRAQERSRDGDSSREQRAQERDTKSDRKSSDTKADRNERRDRTTGQGAAGSSGRASLSSEQRTRITTTIRQSNVRPIRNVNFNISVGTRVPRSVTLHRLPPTVIEVYPAWREYQFILVGDEILIIDPDTYEIVAVIDA